MVLPDHLFFEAVLSLETLIGSTAGVDENDYELILYVMLFVYFIVVGPILLFSFINIF